MTTDIEGDNDLLETIEACRTCGVFYLTTSNYLKNLCTPSAEGEMEEIRMLLLSWNIQVNATDVLPLSICFDCVHEFQRILKFRNSCIDNENELQHFYNSVQRNNNSQIVIKNEPLDPTEHGVVQTIAEAKYVSDFAEQQENCGFIYVDDLDDGDDDAGIGEGDEFISQPAVVIKSEPLESEEAVTTVLKGYYVPSPPIAAEADTPASSQIYESTTALPPDHEQPPGNAEASCATDCEKNFEPAAPLSLLDASGADEESIDDYYCRTCHTVLENCTPTRVNRHQETCTIAVATGGSGNVFASLDTELASEAARQAATEIATSLKRKSPPPLPLWSGKILKTYAIENEAVHGMMVQEPEIVASKIIVQPEVDDEEKDKDKTEQNCPSPSKSEAQSENEFTNPFRETRNRNSRKTQQQQQPTRKDAKTVHECPNCKKVFSLTFRLNRHLKANKCTKN